MIVDHIRNHPDKSLGVISLNSTHQRAIEDTLYDLRRDRPDIDALFLGSSSFGTTDENLFIKNLENVQGDERDFIFLSLGYGFNNVGKFNKNFGPINKQHGERRLNVAITRARESLTFVASVRSADMDLSGTKSEGAHLLKSYLSYAERGVDTLDLAMQEIAGEADSPFEEEVAAALIRCGLQPVSQVGCGGFRIDLALKHPDRPGHFCLAIECDGATYHSSHTARDRDRIRQTVLENLGWTIIRVWSTDWVRNPDRQVERIMAAYEKSLLSPLNPEPESQDDVEEDLEPTFIQKEDDQQRRAKLSFDSIDEVPNDTIDSAAIYVLTQAGAMAVDDLIRQTSRELGFRRTGQKIRARIESRLNADLERGRLKRTGHKIAIVN
jgi:very-short-patch-repair endonuclease